MFITLGGLAVGTIFFGNKGRLGTLLTFATIGGGIALTGFALWLEAQDAGPPDSRVGRATGLPPLVDRSTAQAAPGT